MPKQKYLVTNENGEEMGFLIIEEPTTFTHIIEPTPLEGPIGEVALLFASLVGFTGVTWFIGGPGWVAPAVGVSITAVLAGIKAYRSGGGLTEPDKPKTREVTIKLESWSDEGRVLLDEVQDQTISLEDWRRVAHAVIFDGKNFSRPALSGEISQTTYHKIKGELSRLNMAHKLNNGYVLSPRGMAFLRKIHSLPF